MKLTLDHTQRLDLHALLGAQRVATEALNGEMATGGVIRSGRISSGVPRSPLLIIAPDLGDSSLEPAADLALRLIGLRL